MKNKLFALSIAASFFLTACGGKKSAADVAKKWCELNGKAHNATGDAKAAAEAAVEKYEKEIEAKYKNDGEFMKQVDDEVEKCEDASEGR